MSELTRCNYCSLRELCEKAQVVGFMVSLRMGWRDGFDVYVHPKDIVILVYERLGEHEPYWKAWFMELSDYCVC